MKSFYQKTDANWIRVAILLVFSLFTFIILPNCNPEKKYSKSPSNLKIKETKTGLASYYGSSFEGKETASGEIFDKEEMVAAHPSYPLGTVARITNLEKGGSVDVRIIDRGPTEENVAEGVIIDLSKGAAQKLGMIQEGRVKVKVEVLQWGVDGRK